MLLEDMGLMPLPGAWTLPSQALSGDRCSYYACGAQESKPNGPNQRHRQKKTVAI